MVYFLNIGGQVEGPWFSPFECTAGIYGENRSHLHGFSRGTVTAVKYWDVVLEPNVHLFTNVGPNFI
ncbi:hypothetical protein TNCV_4868001 [Trichonephila clavipes]|nr:hypothetical protein TNCV_4868001 [Trichonephila clavipes]